VESVVIELRFPQPPPFSGDFRHLERVLRAAFGQRRKTLENALAAGLRIEKGRARAALEAAGVDPRARAETLSLEGFAELADRLRDVRPPEE
jgi:16S rRNA (adenine1518-N6/adenine1519-N6)-dimethyltransferase